MSSCLVRCVPLTNFCYVNPKSHGSSARGELAAAIQLCPYIVQVEIHDCYGKFDDSLGALTLLKNMQSVDLCFISVSFDKDILPILQKFGSETLENLELNDLRDVDVAAIIKHCPKLRSLTLGSIGQYTQLPSEHLPQLLNLEHLTIFGRECEQNDGPTTDDISILLLNSPSLVSLTMGHLYELPDQLMERVALLREFPKLKKMELVLCDLLTKRSIGIILLKSPVISSITILFCESLKKDDADQGRKMALDNNWDLSVELEDEE